MAGSGVLVVAATQRELAPVTGARLLACGIGPVEAAAATAAALASDRPEVVLHVGIAGARGLEIPSLVLGSEAVYCDAAAPLVPDRVLPDAELLARLRTAFPDAVVRPIGTSARVGGAHGFDVEAMEGFAVLRACELAGVPGVEARVVSNEIDEPDRTRWRFDEALELLAATLPALVAAVGPRGEHEAPPPLPPETRTVGQLVAESIKLYGDNLWASLALGLSVTVINQISAGTRTTFQVLVLAAGAPLMAASYAFASAIVGGVERRAADLGRAIVVGAIVFVPAAFLSLLYVLPAVAWLALVGLVVPVLVLERLAVGAALRRAVELGRADYVHALGSLATLAILFGLVKLTLALLLRDFGESGERVALGLADLVVSPLLFLGAALLYVDQAARSSSGSA